jgi:hypothetical protein
MTVARPSARLAASTKSHSRVISIGLGDSGSRRPALPRGRCRATGSDRRAAACGSTPACRARARASAPIVSSRCRRRTRSAAWWRRRGTRRRRCRAPRGFSNSSTWWCEVRRERAECWVMLSSYPSVLPHVHGCGAWDLAVAAAGACQNCLEVRQNAPIILGLTWVLI